MGTPEPPLVDEAEFQKKIIIGQGLFAASVGALLVMVLVVVIQAIRKKRRPQLSLSLLLLVTVAAGGCVLSGCIGENRRGSLEQARVDYVAAKARYDAAEQSEKPGHPVTLTKPFYMGKFAVTQEQYQAVIGANPPTSRAKTTPWNRCHGTMRRRFAKGDGAIEADGSASNRS